MPGLREAYLSQATSPQHGEHWSGPPQLVERVAAAAGTRAGHRVLDVGCGIGGPARRLERLVGCRVVGVDLVTDVLAVARRRHPRPGLVAADAARLPFAASSFDQLWSLGAAAHLMDPDAFADQAARVLRPSGTLALTEAFWDGRRPPRFAAIAPAPWRPLTPSSLIDALRRAGFARPRVLPWPGRDLAPDEAVREPALRDDLVNGRLRSSLVVARRSGVW